MAEARRKFDREFREGAVRIVRERGKPIAQVAHELGVNAGTLANWVARDKQDRGGDGRVSEDGRAALARLRRGDGGRGGGGGRLSEDERAELARLRRENAELAMERDVLKRSVALWVKDAMGR